jgi:hypothetical protein
MAIKLISGLTGEWYEPEQEGEDKSRFKIEPLTGLQYHELIGHINDSGKLDTDGVKKCLRYGLKDWDNVGTENPFSVEVAIRSLPAKYLLLISSRIFEVSSFDGEMEKNLESQSK